MISKMKYIELTKENFERYAPQIVALCDKAVLENEKNNKSGQFFTSTLEELLGYVNSNGKDFVMMAINESDLVEGAMYINTLIKQGTYSDLTKYFHVSSEYKNYLINQFSSVDDYKKYITEGYLEKILTYAEIGEKIEQDKSLNPKGLSFNELVNLEISSDRFQENNPIREAINNSFYEYYSQKGKVNDYAKLSYYGINDVDKELLKIIGDKKISLESLEQLIENYETFLVAQKPIFVEEPTIDLEPYYDANMDNTIEFNTYVVSENARSNGLAKILTYETLKRAVAKIFSNPTNNAMYINTTIHNENKDSQATVNFFGLEDYIYIERKKDINRRVYMKRVSREESLEYLYDIELKLLLSYNYYSEIFGISMDEIKDMVEEHLISYQRKLELANDSKKKEYYQKKIDDYNALLNQMMKGRR